MDIWHQKTSLQELNAFALRKGALIDLMGIKFSEIGNNTLKATMKVDDRVKQPAGIMHGGASCVLAETIGSIASFLATDPSKKNVVGMDINTSHIRSVREGYVEGVCTPIHIGDRSHIWQIKIFNEKQELISITRFTTAILDKH